MRATKRRNHGATKGLTAVRAAMTALLLVFGVLALGQGEAKRDEVPAPPVVRFAAYDVFVDSRDMPLAAWQVDVHAPGDANAGTVRIVGIEGGDHEAYATPPVYDPRAIQHDRVVIGDYSTRAEPALPRGKVRVARIHVRTEGPEGFAPEFRITLETAATRLGARIDATATIEEGERP